MGVSITKKEDYWQASGSLLGVRIRRRFDKTLPKAAVQKLVDAMLKDVLDDRLGVKESRRTVAEACKAYLRDRKTLSMSSIVRVRQFERVFGKARLIEVTGEDVREWAREQTGWSEATRRSTVAIVQAMFNHAAEKGWCKPMQAKKSVFKESPVRDRFLSEEEEERLLLAMPEYMWPLVVMSLMTGARNVELRNLRWEDVTEPTPGRLLVKLTHTKGSGDERTRFVPLNPRACDALKEQARLNGQASVPLAKRRGAVFRNLWGMAWANATHCGRVFEEAAERGGVEDVGLHDLRRTFASRMVARGVDLKTVADLLGHSDLAQMARYAHLAPGVADAAVGVL